MLTLRCYTCCSLPCCNTAAVCRLTTPRPPLVTTQTIWSGYLMPTAASAAQKCSDQKYFPSTSLPLPHLQLCERHLCSTSSFPERQHNALYLCKLPAHFKRPVQENADDACCYHPGPTQTVCVAPNPCCSLLRTVNHCCVTLHHPICLYFLYYSIVLRLLC